MQQTKPNKKIGIVTRYDDNYGACLQAAALQKALSKLNFACETIRIEESVQKKNNRFVGLLTTFFKLGIAKTASIILSRKFIRARKAGFNRFRKNTIAFSQGKHKVSALGDIANQYDAFVCGSDMIWCEEFLPLLDAYFLSFAPKGKRVAFSPSFGRPILESENEEKYTKYLQGMDHLACREESGIDIVKKLTGKTPTHTIDPTFLLTKQEWETLIPAEHAVTNREPYILRYLFTDLTASGKRILEQAGQCLNSQSRCIPSRFWDYAREKKNGILGHGPYEFLQLYRDAQFVVTNTFHGLAFALIFEKPFIVFKREDAGKWAKYDDRLVGLLKKLHLEDRYISQNDAFKKEWLELDYSVITPLLEEWREQSLTYLCQALKDAFSSEIVETLPKIEMPFSAFDQAKCVGCAACESVCPTKSIQMIQNHEGFLYPTLNKELCVKCGACERVCQLSNDFKPSELTQPLASYCALSNDTALWKKSASGGMAAKIARYFCENEHGFVCGCVMDENQRVRHEIVTDEKLLNGFAGSKYVQSDLSGVFEDIKTKLHSGMRGVFFGTPCQVASLKLYLGDLYRDNLLTVDLICHGVPSPSFFEKAINHYRNLAQTPITTFRFRSKIGWYFKKFYGYVMRYQNGRTLKIPAKCDAYYNLFLQGKSFRESCYTCPFATIPRCSDITLGDCDTSAEYYQLGKGKSISTMLINTPKGEKVFEACRKDISFSILDLTKEAKANHQLSHPFQRPVERSEIYKNITELSYSELNRKYATGYGKKQKVMLFLLETLPTSICRILLRVFR